MSSERDDWVRANDFRAQWSIIAADVHAAVERVGRGGWYILGEEVVAFERALAARLGDVEVVGCASGLDAIELALRALGLRAGERVLTTPFSAFATTLAIVRAGGVPVFVDIDETGCLDLDAAERVLTGGGVRWMVPVHLYGHPMAASRLAEVAQRYELRLVEDCAQSIGSDDGAGPTGRVGQAAATSFYPTKNLGAMGDGGAVWTSSPQLAAQLRRLRDYGQEAKYRHTLLGLNSRLDELHAAILRCAFLPRLDGWIERRRAIARRYAAEISNRVVTVVSANAGTTPSGHLFPLLVDDPSRFIEHLRGAKIESGRHYPSLIPDQPALAETRFEVAGALDRAQEFARCEVSIPIQAFLDEDEVDRVIAACNGYAS